MNTCVLHLDREARQDAQGILVCPLCWLRYNDERRATNNGAITQRPFLQELVAARHALKRKEIRADVAAFVALLFTIGVYLFATALGQQQ